MRRPRRQRPRDSARCRGLASGARCLTVSVLAGVLAAGCAATGRAVRPEDVRERLSRVGLVVISDDAALLPAAERGRFLPCRVNTTFPGPPVPHHPAGYLIVGVNREVAETKEAIDLDEEDVAAGYVSRPSDGKRVKFGPTEVIRGIARTYTTEDYAHKQELFERGEIVCFQSTVGTDDATSRLEVRPDQLGFWAVPPRRAEDPPVLYMSSHWLGLSPSLS